MSELLSIVTLLVSTGGIIFGYHLLRNPGALELNAARWVPWTLLICGVVGVVGFGLWLIFRVAGRAS
jgi:hypothetical protein